MAMTRDLACASVLSPKPQQHAHQILEVGSNHSSRSTRCDAVALLHHPTIRSLVGALTDREGPATLDCIRRADSGKVPALTEGGPMLIKVLALTAFALLTSSSALAAAGGCHAISGTYQNQNVPCVPQAIACVESQVTGDLGGTSLTLITGLDLATQVFTGTATNVSQTGPCSKARSPEPWQPDPCSPSPAERASTRTPPAHGGLPSLSAELAHTPGSTARERR